MLQWDRKLCGAPVTTVPSLDLRPLLGIDSKRAHLSRLCVIEGAMMRDPSITNELRQHGEGTRRQGLVDERLLSRKGLYSGAAGQLISPASVSTISG